MHDFSQNANPARLGVHVGRVYAGLPNGMRIAMKAAVRVPGPPKEKA